jgi:hypothetical protein
VNPEFATEKEFGEQAAEVAGQAAPAAGLAARCRRRGPCGHRRRRCLDPDVQRTRTASQNLANDYADGAVPDVLVVNPDDSQEAKTAKNFATNLIVDLATAGLSHGVGSRSTGLVKGVPDGFVDMNSLKQIA